MARKITLSGDRLGILFNVVMTSIHRDRYVNKCLMQAQEAIMRTGKYELKKDGGIKFDAPENGATVHWGKEILFGLRIALQQAILGNEQRPPATLAQREYNFLPLAKLLGDDVLKALRKGCNLDGDAEEEMDVEWSDDLKEEAEDDDSLEEVDPVSAEDKPGKGLRALPPLDSGC